MIAGKSGPSSASPGHSTAGLNLLLCEADERAPVMDRDLGTSSATTQERLSKTVLPKTLWNEGGDPNSLPEQLDERVHAETVDLATEQVTHARLGDVRVSLTFRVAG